ncbi:MAG: S1-like domain-containing RNA-binding protein [Spirochaetales bacterium]|nr:S1-like domain-containing RNA-binding protein [Spirochaetales bacterium]
MLKIGTYNNFRVVKSTSRGWHLEGGEEQLFVPKRELPPGTIVGHKVKLFVYNKGKGEIRATSRIPYAQVDQFAYLKVKDVTSFGMFMDWGIDKDIFVPNRFIKEKPDAGTSHIIRLFLDEAERSVIGSCLLDDFIQEKPGKELKRNQQARLLICGIKDIGFRVIINDKYRGMLYRDEQADSIRYGDKKQGYIKKIRRDGLIDVSLFRD